MIFKPLNRRKFLGRTFKMTAFGIFVPTIIEPRFDIAYAATGTALIVDNSGDKVQSLLNEIAISRPFSIPSFSILRVGVRCSINGSTVAGSPSFYIGAQSGTTKQPFDANWVNCLIANQIGGSWSTLGSGTSLRFSPLSWHATSLVGSTFTDDTQWGSLISISGKTHSGAPCMMMAEMIVGSPLWTVRSFTPVQAGTNTALAQSDFYAQMVATTPAWTGYTYNTSPNSTFTFSQAAGIINTACFGWLNTTPMEVTDFAVTFAP